METHELQVVLNRSLIAGKLDSVSRDIKYYVNANFGKIGNTTRTDLLEQDDFLSDPELEELLRIRGDIKRLAHRLNNKKKS